MNNEHGMKCSEVCGGRGATNRSFSRPGLDVYIRSLADAPAGGGDLHLASSCASGRITRLLLAEICGDGPVFVKLASELRNLIRRNVNSIRQASCVREMNRLLQEAALHGGYASTLVGTFFAPTRSFTLCNAGHPPPLYYRAKARTWSLLLDPHPVDADQLLLGVVDQQEYQQVTLKLEVGDCIVLYSNVFTERATAAGELRGARALLQWVQGKSLDDPGQLAAALLNDAVATADDSAPPADATVIVCRATPTGVAWQDSLLAPLRLLQPVADRTHIPG